MRSYLLGYLYVRRKCVHFIANEIDFTMRACLVCFSGNVFLIHTNRVCVRSFKPVLELQSLNLWYCIFAVWSQILPNSLRLVWAPTDTKGVLFLNEWALLLRSNLKKLVKMNLVYFTVCLRYSLLSDANKLYTSRGNIRHSKNRTWLHLTVVK